MRVRLTLIEEKSLPGIQASYLRTIVKEVLACIHPEILQRSMTVMLEVVSVSDSRMQELNTKYRKKKKPTDILSFGERSQPLDLTHDVGNILNLGQLFLSPDFIRRSAKTDGVLWKHEFTYVFAHGVLHLLGFDHSSEMFAIQDRVTHTLIQQQKVK